MGKGTETTSQHPTSLCLLGGVAFVRPFSWDCKMQLDWPSTGGATGIGGVARCRSLRREQWLDWREFVAALSINTTQ